MAKANEESNAEPKDDRVSGSSNCSTALSLLGEVTRTIRGFQRAEFPDANGHQCSVQASSVIDDTERGYENPGSSYLWIGPDEAEPRIMASQAASFGVTTAETTGLVPFPVPDEVFMTTRMHLSRDHVAELIVVLKRWLDTGSLEP